MAVVKIGGQDTAIPDFNGRKAIRAARIMRDILDSWPGLQLELAKFKREYEKANVRIYDRASARVRFGVRPVVDEAGEPVRYPMTVTVNRVEAQHPKAGEVVHTEDQLAHMTERDWEASGHEIRQPISPSDEETFLAMFPLLFDKAEEHVIQLIGLAVVTGEDLGRAAREGGDDQIRKLLSERGETILDQANIAEMANVILTAAEMAQEQVVDQMDDLKRRSRPLMRLIGKLRQAPTTSEPTIPSSSEPKPDLSTPSPAPTDGMSEPLSTEPALSSSSS